MFFEENKALLQNFSRMSKTLGDRVDYVQGGGGNTSVKLTDDLMAIKASGFCLSDIEPDKAYAVVDGANVRDFYLTSEPSKFEDVEQMGSAKAKAAIRAIEGLEPLRPSVEVGFHSLLKTFVAHTHSVYANLATCSCDCRDIAKKTLRGADYSWGWVPYTDPGANLTFAIRDELCRVERETGRIPAIILMQNHGIIAHDDDPDRCMAIHDDANDRLAAAFGLTGTSFPRVTIAQSEDGLFENRTVYLTQRLKNCKYSYQQLMDQPLYPDQMVFLKDTFYMNLDAVGEGQCVAYTDTGRLVMRMNEKKAQVLAETLTAVIFVMEHVEQAGHSLSTMGTAAKRFIAGWESETYRKSLVGIK